jgi:FkbM family methyltransferase
VSAQKSVQIGQRRYELSGLSSEDIYFKAVHDNFQPEFSRLIETFIRPDYVCLDVGANIGVKSLQLAQLATNGHVIAVEPSSGAFACLQENIRKSGHSNISSRSCAIGASDSYARFVDNSAFGYLSETGSTEVKVMTIASLVDELHLKRLDFIKIDVEGSEQSIMEASLEVTNRFGSLIMFEMNSWCMLGLHNSNPRAFLEWVTKSFSYVFMLRPREPVLLRPIAACQALTALHDHLVYDGALTDFIVTNDAGRLHVNTPSNNVEERPPEATSRISSFLRRFRH